MKNDHSFKVVVIGSPGVGKSSLLNRLTHDTFSQKYDVTMGAQFFSKTIVTDQNSRIKLQIWDTAGQQSFRSIVRTFYRGAAAVFLVYSTASERSFKDLDYWFDEATEAADQNTVFALIGTQKDRRKVPIQKARQFMSERDIAFMFETSAKTSENVQSAFMEAAQQIILKRIIRKHKLPDYKTTSANRIKPKEIIAPVDILQEYQTQYFAISGQQISGN